MKRRENVKARGENEVIFIYVDKEVKVEEILDAIKNPEGWKNKFLINAVRQADIPKDEKWIKIVFNTHEIEAVLKSSPLIMEAKNFLKLTMATF